MDRPRLDPGAGERVMQTGIGPVVSDWPAVSNGQWNVGCVSLNGKFTAWDGTEIMSYLDWSIGPVGLRVWSVGGLKSLLD